MDGFSNYFGLPFLIGAERDYYENLPDDIKAGINERENEIHSAEDLHRIAELLEKKQ